MLNLALSSFAALGIPANKSKVLENESQYLCEKGIYQFFVKEEIKEKLLLKWVVKRKIDSRNRTVVNTP